MNLKDLRKNTKEELIIYIEKLSRDMTTIQLENLELRKKNKDMEKYIYNLENDNKEKDKNISNL